MDQAGKVTSPLQPLAIKRPPRASVILRVFWMLGASVLVAVGGGCSMLQGVQDYIEYNDMTDDFVVGWRNFAWANKAWHARKACHACEPQFHNFGEGFRAGYRDVASGSNGCPPPLPPRQYWSWKYQNPEGQAKIAAWFAGYPHGAKAAEEDCAGNWRQIPVSHVIEQQYSPEFTQAQIPRCDGSCFPQPTDQLTPDGHAPPADQLPLPEGLPLERQLPTAMPAPGGTSPVGSGQNLGAPPPTARPGLPPAPPPTDNRLGYSLGPTGFGGY